MPWAKKESLNYRPMHVLLWAKKQYLYKIPDATALFDEINEINQAIDKLAENAVHFRAITRMLSMKSMRTQC